MVGDTDLPSRLRAKEGPEDRAEKLQDQTSKLCPQCAECSREEKGNFCWEIMQEVTTPWACDGRGWR